MSLGICVIMAYVSIHAFVHVWADICGLCYNMQMSLGCFLKPCLRAVLNWPCPSLDAGSGMGSGELALVAWVGKAGGLTNSVTSLAQIQVFELTLTSTIYELLEHVKGSVLVLHCLHDSGQQLGI